MASWNKWVWFYSSWQITKTLEPTNDYLSGFFSGKEEYEIELGEIQLDDLEQLRNKSKDREQGLEQEG